MAIVLLALPTAASAKPGHTVIKGGKLAIFQAGGSNGYRIFGFFSSPNIVVLGAIGRSSSVTYVVHARMVGDRLDARFGDRGRISVRFKPSGPAKSEADQTGRCRGRGSISRTGSFVGTIRFRGERSFTDLDIDAAKGQVFRSFRTVCKKSSEPSQGHEDPADGSVSLVAHARDEHRALDFRVYKMSDSGIRSAGGSSEDAAYSATLAERRPHMLIYRSASAFAGADTFGVSPLGASPTTGSVTPPAPFSGTASFERLSDEDSSWSGDLSVELPGRDRVRLAGPSFSAGLCRDIGCACNRRHECISVVAVSAETRQAMNRIRPRLRERLPWLR